MNYKGYTIERETNINAIYAGYNYRIGEGDMIESFQSLEDAKDYVDERIIKQYPEWQVRHAYSLPAATFNWLSDAVQFAVKYNAIDYNLKFDSI